MFRKMKISILLTSILTSLFLLQVVSGVLFLNYAKDQKTHTVLLDYETKKVAALDGAWIALIRSRFEINRAQNILIIQTEKIWGILN
ncbi:hypothetical protein UA45_20450 [Morganella morganii]|uniref:Chemotaxis methyl-accepting receptor Tar-related ligand-binding domain-containing protein n=1 Tax=Morganella morganii TaxID=582 RepID=A0A0D8L2A6_MORMO|nr:hypothetical protein UA45_20450 [Morganella morganii]